MRSTTRRSTESDGDEEYALFPQNYRYRQERARGDREGGRVDCVDAKQQHGHAAHGTDSGATATSGVSATSASLTGRPRTIGIPIAAKYSGPTSAFAAHRICPSRSNGEAGSPLVGQRDVSGQGHSLDAR
jgi:hypothetical protein